jgi:5-methylcytosine-specific restriction endonuclease McrA
MGCLALNASFEPLTILPVRRALRLVIDRKAEVLEVDENRVFRSERREMPCPSVIRLVRYVHVPRRFRRQVTNTFLFARDGYRCQYCNKHRSELRGREFLTRDHIVPLSLGGDNGWENVVTACSACNNRKGSHLPEQVGMHPLHMPVEPNYVELVWAVRRITPVQAKWIRMFYGEDVLRALQTAEAVHAA